MPDSECECLRAGPIASARAASYLGIDHTGGRFAEVEIEECTLCRRKWLHYEVNYDDLPNPIRWFRGWISEEIAERVMPETAVEAIESLQWYLIGGDYFGTEGRRSSGPLDVDR